MAVLCLIKKLYPEYMRNYYSLTMNCPLPEKDNGKRLEVHTHKKRLTDGIRKMKIESTMRCRIAHTRRVKTN